MPLPFVDLKAQYDRLRAPIDEAIRRVLEHGQYVMGPEVGELEERLAAFVGARHAVAVSSGTDALLIALMAWGIGRGDAVLVPSFTFTASAEVILLLGARPIFVDVSEKDFNLDIESLHHELARFRSHGEETVRAIMAVDLFGLPAEHPALGEVAREEGLLLLDDAAQGLGGSIDGCRVGSLAPITATSFFPAKPLGGYGDGGALFTDDDGLAERMRSIRQHGEGSERYEIVRVGVNGRLDSLQAAVLLAKLTIFEDELERRERLARFYDERLADVVTVPTRQPGYRSAWAQYTVRVEDRDRVRKALAEEGIPSAVYYPLPMHLQSAYAAYGRGEGSLPVSERLCREVLSLPMHPYLEEEDAERICEVVRRSAPRARSSGMSG